jgi:hypothetical protein
MNAIRKSTEDQLQKSVVGWLQLQEAMGRLTYHAVPNEGKRSYKTAARLQSIGMRAGVPDLVIIGHFGVGYIELKTPAGRQSDFQKAWEARLKDFEIPHAICRSLESVMQTVNGWCGL